MVAARTSSKGRSRVSGCTNPEHRPLLLVDGLPTLDDEGWPVRLPLDTPCTRWANLRSDGRGTYRPPLTRRARAAVMHSMRHVILVALLLVAFLAVTHIVVPKIKGYNSGTGGIFHKGVTAPQSPGSPVPTGHPKP